AKGQERTRQFLALANEKEIHEALSHLIYSSVSSMNNEEKITSCILLGRIGKECVVIPLVKLLQDNNRKVQWNAGNSLSGLISEENCELLQKILEDPFQRNAHKIILRILRKTQSEKCERMIEEFKERAQSQGDYFMMGESLRAMNKEDVVAEWTCEFLQLEGSILLETVIRLIGERSQIRFQSELKELLMHPSVHVRRETIKTLATRPGASVDEFIPLLSDSDEQTRWEVIDAIQRVGGEDCIPALICILADPKSDALHNVRWGIEMALEQIGGMATSRAVIPLLTNPDGDVVWRARLVLDHIAEPDMLVELMQENANEKQVVLSILKVLSNKEILSRHLVEVGKIIQTNGDSGLQCFLMHLYIKLKPEGYHLRIAETIPNLKEAHFLKLIGLISQEHHKELLRCVIDSNRSLHSIEYERLIATIQSKLDLLEGGTVI
ncbi:MAG: HEAT repeat domain-containing protein, partial [Candidatus Thorarchaeota archaeon]|nr:HEAT repeat domain-containing protein [Candidatus Thorarchaeota archaeon]